MSGIQLNRTVFGAWTLKEQIGEGAYGKVYRIERDEFGIKYQAALKIITIPQNKGELQAVLEESGDQRSARQFFQGVVNDLIEEIRLMTKLKGCSNIVSYEDHQVIEHEDHMGWDILIRMELLTPLNEYIRTHGLTRDEVIKLGVDICKALEICSKYSIVHRDIKPGNIFVNKFGEFKLGDFGIARIVDKDTSGLSKKGTVNYMAPEVWRGETYDATVDLYSLGLVMYRLLNRNRMPFMPLETDSLTHTEREEALARRLSGEPLPMPVNADKEIGHIICKSCAPSAQDRYQSAADLRNALEQISAGQVRVIEPVNAQIIDENATVATRKLDEKGVHAPKNNKRWYMLLAACICLLLAGIVWGCLALLPSENKTGSAENTAPAEGVNDVQLTEGENNPSAQSTPTTDLPNGKYEAFFAKHEALMDRESIFWQSAYGDYGLEKLFKEQYARKMRVSLSEVDVKFDWYDDSLISIGYEFVDLNFDDIPELIVNVGSGMSHHHVKTSIYEIRGKEVQLIWDSPNIVGDGGYSGMELVLLEDTKNKELAWMLRAKPGSVRDDFYLDTEEDCVPDKVVYPYDAEVERFAIIHTNDNNDIIVEKVYEDFVFSSWDDESLVERKSIINGAYVDPSEYDAQCAADADRYRATIFVLEPTVNEAKRVIPYIDLEHSGNYGYNATAKNWIRAQDLFPQNGTQLFEMSYYRGGVYPEWYEKYKAYIDQNQIEDPDYDGDVLLIDGEKLYEPYYAFADYDKDGVPELIMKGDEAYRTYEILRIADGKVEKVKNFVQYGADCSVLWNKKTGERVVAWLWDIGISNDYPSGSIFAMPDAARRECFMFDANMDMADVSMWEGEIITRDEFAKRWDAFWVDWEELGSLVFSPTIPEAYGNYGKMENTRVIETKPAEQKIEDVYEFFAWLESLH